MSEVYDVSDVIITGDQILLFDFKKTKFQNIYNLVKSVDIYESLNNYTLQADFYIADGIELLNYFPIAGEEHILLSFETPSRAMITYEFFVTSIVAQKSNDQSNLKTYILRCVTKDYLKNSHTLFSKRYTNMDYDAALNTVIKQDLKSSKPLNVESTKGKFDYVVNGVRPLQVVNLITERAVSAKYKSSFFVFYEDNQGYHFTTIEKLIEERKSGAADKEFVYDTSNRLNDYEKVINFRNILSYETLTQGTTVDKVKSGAFKNQVREFDISTGDYYNKYEYVNPSDQMSFQKTDNVFDFNSDAFNAEVIDMPATSKMVLKDGKRPDMKHNEVIHMKRAFFDRIQQYGLRIRVYGDTSIRVGDIIKASLPDISGVTVEPEQQKIYSENYIIIGLKHILDQKVNAKFEHYMILDIRKPNMFTAIG
jgi:hypothetical protein